MIMKTEQYGNSMIDSLIRARHLLTQQHPATSEELSCQLAFLEAFQGHSFPENIEPPLRESERASSESGRAEAVPIYSVTSALHHSMPL